MGKAFVRELRKLKTKNTKGALKVEMMLLLVEARPNELLWRGDYDTWDDLLREEKPCSVTRFYRFERALKLITVEDIEQFGVTATTTHQWFDGHKVKPGHKQVAKFVWTKKRRLAPEQDFVSRGRLVRYIDSLKGQLKEAGLKPKLLSRVK